MNLFIISASQRENSQSAKVANYIAETATGYNTINHIPLWSLNIPFWDGERQSDTSDWSALAKKVKAADALVLITPEWSGIASPLLKNFLLMCDAKLTAHKPALLVSVSSGVSGTYPIAELRMNAFKNNKLVAIPDHLIIRNVTECLNASHCATEQISSRDKNTKERIAYSLHTLFHYSQSMRSLRAALSNNPFKNEQNYSYGM